MGTLNPDLPSQELHQTLNDAATLMRQMKKRVMMPELLLLAFIRAPDSAAYRVLAQFAEKRGFRISELEKRTESQARSRIGRDADFDYRSASGEPVPLSHEMLVVLDEGRAIAQTTNEVWIGTDHALAAMSQAGVSTAGLLQRFGITPQAMTDLLTDRTLGRRSTCDWVQAARRGEMVPVHHRQALLNHPSVLIVDEPTSGLDPEERIRLRNLLAELASGRIVILSTHIVSDVEVTSERLAILHLGRLLYSGTLTDLLAPLHGRTWIIDVEEEELSEVRDEFFVTGVFRSATGMQVRALADEMTHPRGYAAAPTLDDAYVATMQKEASASAAA